MNLADIMMRQAMIGQLQNYYAPNRKQQIDKATEIVDNPNETTPRIQQPEMQSNSSNIRQHSDGSWWKWDDFQQAWVPMKGGI